MDVYSDVERWPEWTASVTSVELHGGAPLATGKRARIKQPRLPVTTWTVTALHPGRSWTWAARSPGVNVVADHIVEPLADGRTRAVLTIDQRGVLGRPIGWVARGLTRRYLRMEAEGLRRRSEAAADRPG